jgi:poly(3-hydroxybutyrate) depolymerase
MRRGRPIVVAIGLVLAVASGTASARPGPALLYSRPATVPLLKGSRTFRAAPLLVSGTDGYRRGEYLYQDYLFDDYGADTTPGLGASANWGSQPLFAPAAGDLQYPAGNRYLNDAADLVEFRIRPTRHAIAYRVTLNTATARSAAVVGIGIDTDRRGGAPVAWPRGAGVSSPGLDAFITAWGTGGEVTLFHRHRATKLPRGAVRMNLARNQMTIVVPRSLMNPRGATWRYVAGTGLWDGHGWMSISPGAASVFNLAFRFHEPVGSVHGTGAGLPGYTTEPGTGSWFEDGQARELGQGTTGGDYADVSFRALAHHASADLHRPGRTQARIYGSSLRLPEGVDHDVFPEFRGALQPYLVTLPPDYRRGRRSPLLFALHPSNSGYQTFHVFMPNWLKQLGAERSSIVVTMLSRGLNGPDPNSGEFTGAAEADFFEAWKDLRRHYSIDASRVVLSGYSLGAYDSYHLAEVAPDLFASMFSVVGAPPTNGRDTELLANLRWIPVLAWNQADDALVPYTDASAAASKLRALRLRHEQWTFPAGNHLAPAQRDDWGPAAKHIGLPAVERDPPRIDFGYYPSLDSPAYGLVHNHAYWISRIRLAHRAQPSALLARGDVSAHSLAFGEADRAATDYTGTGVAGNSPALIQGTSWAAPTPAPLANELDMTLHNIRYLRVDGARARLSGARPLTVRTDADGSARLLIVLPHRSVEILVPSGNRVTVIHPRPHRVRNSR